LAFSRVEEAKEAFEKAANCYIAAPDRKFPGVAIAYFRLG